ncbi:MAG: HAMP domain-containing histidine kinase [Planctomycetaceae bacterium]|nr:HAMP domain-containing histidine kinase [Planctomycetaceae bacterium]
MNSLPPVAVLLRGCLPFRDADDLLHKLAATWGEVLGCSACHLARWEPLTGQVEYFARVDGEEWDEFDVVHRWVNAPGDVTEVSEIARSLFSSTDTVFPLTVQSHTVGWMQLIAQRPINEIPRDWLDQTSRMLQQVGLWRAAQLQSKLRALGEYAAGAGHEVNNPLAAISGRVQQLLPGESDPERRRMLETIGGQTLRIRDMISDSMLFARPPEPQRQPTSLMECWQTVIDRLQPEITERSAQVIPPTGDVLLDADPTQLTIVLAELLRNSLHAIQPGGQIRLDIRSTTGPLAHLVWSDNGCGLTEAEHEHLFDPFYSARQAGRGLGFGLSKAWRITTGHGGHIVCATGTREGAEFHLHWPKPQ